MAKDGETADTPKVEEPQAQPQTSGSSFAPTPSPSARRQHPTLSSLNSTPANSQRRERERERDLPRITPSSSSPSVSHRSSFAENLRGVPSSPRQRNPSFSQQALQDLINNPPVARHSPAGDKYQDRDWRSIKVGEIISPEQVRFVESDTSVEAATKLLIESGPPNVVLVRHDKSTRQAIGSFDYDDLNAYLLLVTNLAYPAGAEPAQLDSVLQKAGSNEPVPLADVQHLLGRKDPPAFLDHNDTLTRAVEIFGGGVHRIMVRKQGSDEVIGVLSQLRLVRFFWENMADFRAVFQLHNRTLKELGLGSQNVISISGDKPLKEALLLMHAEGVSSLCVLDSHSNVIGNISHVDVRLLTDTSALPLLDSSCIHFISVILSERGMHEGKDSYPVFHVTPYSTLAHTVAKLVATRSHRMWIVDAPSPSSSIPTSPAITPGVAAPPSALQQLSSHASGPPYTPAAPSIGVSASALPGASLSGHLNGVISLTDVLNLYARVSGLSPQDPEETRRRRRRSSSSSVRKSIDGLRGSLDLSRSGESIRSSIDLSRSSSQRR
ncbi:hypothetical protein AAFC00_004121 [Neodothiora populina]|uniref:CBS domain-containing protein n=1 Tax=Neodothiora populina TaxID=2781224 RepID=A0ABR3PIL0_9PEZI